MGTQTLNKDSTSTRSTEYRISADAIVLLQRSAECIVHESERRRAFRTGAHGGSTPEGFRSRELRCGYVRFRGATRARSVYSDYSCAQPRPSGIESAHGTEWTIPAMNIANCGGTSATIHGPWIPGARLASRLETLAGAKQRRGRFGSKLAKVPDGRLSLSD